MKLFIAINFNTDTRSRLFRLCNELHSISERGNFIRPENLHLTLVFLGECDVLKTASAKHVMSTIKIEPFDLTIEHIGRFQRNNGDIWWAGLQESKELIRIQEDLTDNLINKGFALEKREYKPHITLGCKIVTEATPWLVVPFGEKVNSIDLVKSEVVEGKLTYTTIYSTGDTGHNYTDRLPRYNYKDIISIIDAHSGSFIDFALKTKYPIITDYSRINREIIVSNDNVISLGNKRNKTEITSTVDLEKTLSVFLPVVYMNFRDNMAYLKGETIPDIDKFFSSLGFVKMANLIISQVTFDILYDKYLMDSPWLTLWQYCEKYVCYGWESSISEKDKSTKPAVNHRAIRNESGVNNETLFLGSRETKSDNHDEIRATYEWMASAIKREVDIMDNPALRENAIKLGRNPDTYIDFLEELNEPYKDNKKKPKFMWDYIYYNGHPALITSKQFKRSFNKRDKNNKKHNNYKVSAIYEYFRSYDKFIRAAFVLANGNEEDYFLKTMDFYHLEIYKRIDFMYKLAVRMETASANNKDILSLNMGKDILSVKRFHPAVFWPIEDNDKNSLRYDDKHKYYKPLLFIEELWQKLFVNDAVPLYNESDFDIWHNVHMLRAKVYELFKYHCIFTSDDYADIAMFLRKHYDVLAYHDPNKEWIQEGKKLKRENEIRLKYAMDINDALFWDSDKRKPVKRGKNKKGE